MNSSFEIKGALAQLVERLAGSEEVRGSTPLGSTNTRSTPANQRILEAKKSLAYEGIPSN